MVRSAGRTRLERPHDKRLAQRRQRAGPILAAFKPWLDKPYAKSPLRSVLARVMLYTLNRWKALSAYLVDGMLGIDNKPVENATRGIALGRNYVEPAVISSRGHARRDCTIIMPSLHCA